MTFLDSIKRILGTAKKIVKEKGFFHYIKYLLGWFASGTKLKVHNYYYIFYSKILRKPVIHVIGDSHSLLFKNERFFIVHWLGPATAYNVMNEKSSTYSMHKINKILRSMKKSDILAFYFGEIDCRAQVYKQYLKNDGIKSMSSIIDEVVKKYEHFLKYVAEKGCRFCVMSVIPAGIGYDASLIGIGDYAPPPKIHAKIKVEFNKKLKNLCLRNGFIFIDVFNKVSDVHGFAYSKYLIEDKYHFNKKVIVLIKNELQKKLNIKL